MLFIDLEKAYDKVPREVPWKCLEARGALVANTRAIKDMYNGVSARVRIMRGDSKDFPVVMGLHQGQLLTPFLFTLVMVELTWQI